MLRRLFALVVLVVLVGGGLYYWKGRQLGLDPPRSFDEVGRKLEDVALAGKVRAALELNRRLASHPLEAGLEDGVVTLRGRVPDADTAALAVRVVAAVPGVLQVVNHLRADPMLAAAGDQGDGRSAGERLDDEALAMKVRLALSLDRTMAGSGVTVTVFRREVTLGAGTASAPQARRAEEIAADVPGVTAVRTSAGAGEAPPAEATPEARPGAR